MSGKGTTVLPAPMPEWQGTKLMLKQVAYEKAESRTEGAKLTPSARWTLASLSLSTLLSAPGTSIANVALPELYRRRSAPCSRRSGGASSPICWPSPPNRRRRPPTAAGRGGLFMTASLLCSAHALATYRRPGGAGTGDGRHDGPYHGPYQRDGSEGEDHQRHGGCSGRCPLLAPRSVRRSVEF